VSLLDIVQYPDDFLSKPTTPVENIDGEFQQFIDDMAETMYIANGIGLAAIQVGNSKVSLFMIFSGKITDEIFKCW
jgi:peptide deformylase